MLGSIGGLTDFLGIYHVVEDYCRGSDSEVRRQARGRDEQELGHLKSTLSAYD